MTADEIAALWRAYRADPTTARRNRLVEHYLPLAKGAADQFAKRAPNAATVWDDLYSDAAIGLIGAVESYDPDDGRGATFQTFCSRRVRGAVVDALRRRDWVPRLVRAVHKAGGPPPATVGPIVTESEASQTSGRATPTEPPAPAGVPFARLQRDDLVRLVTRELSPTQARAVVPYYFEGVTQIEVAERLGVTRAYVSMLAHEARQTLRGALAGREDEFVS